MQNLTTEEMIIAFAQERIQELEQDKTASDAKIRAWNEVIDLIHSVTPTLTQPTGEKPDEKITRTVDLNPGIRGNG
jgi:hypothetical protein